MPKISGQGGNVTVNNVAIPVANWTLNYTSIIDDVTDSDSQGWAEGMAILRKIQSIDFTTYEIALGMALVPGQFCDGALKLGASATLIVFTMSVVRDLVIEVDASRALRMRVSLEYGMIVS